MKDMNDEKKALELEYNLICDFVKLRTVWE